MFEVELELKPQDLEPIYLHVNHARTLSFLERARLEFLEKLGFSSPFLISQDIFPVIARIEIDYKREISCGPIRVSCEEGRIEHKSMWLKQRLFIPSGKEAVSALVQSKFMLGKTKRAVPVMLDFKEVFEAFFQSLLRSP